MARIRSTIILVFFSLFLFAPITQAHPGKTDADGCHTCYTNCTEKWGLEYGKYHCHEKKVKVKTEARTEARTQARR